MNKPTYSLDKFLQKIATLPVVQQMVEEENERNNADALKARIDCIHRVEALGIEQGEAQEKLDSAVASLKAAEEKITPYRIRAAAANQLVTDAGQRYQAAARSLSFDHGEKHVPRVFMVLCQLRDHCKAQIENLSASLNPHYFVDGHVTFRPVHPSIKPILESQKLRLQVIEQAFSTAGLLVHVKITPSELKTQTEALLAAVGYRPNVVETFNDEPML